MNKQSGVFLLEALVAILIFAFGALGMLAMSSAAISGQGDAQVRTDAARPRRATRRANHCWVSTGPVRRP